jgi:hypothetical protein
MASYTLTFTLKISTAIFAETLEHRSQKRPDHERAIFRKNIMYESTLKTLHHFFFFWMLMFVMKLYQTV